MDWNLDRIDFEEMTVSDWEDYCEFWIRLELQQLVQITPAPPRYTSDVLNPEEYDEYWMLWDLPAIVDTGGNWHESD